MFENIFAERGLSLDRLRALIEVAQAGSIAQAVRGDSVRQSLYSRQIKELEEFFGTELTKKQGKVLVLTDRGRELVRISSEAFIALDDFKCLCTKKDYRFVMGGGDSLHAWITAPILSQISQQSLPWNFSLTNLRNREVSKALLNMDIDFGLIRSSAITAVQLSSAKIARLSYALYVPSEMIAHDKNRDFAWLIKNKPLTTIDSSSSFCTSLGSALAKHNIGLNLVCEAQSFPYAARLLKTRSYMAFLPTIAEIDLDDSFTKISHPSLHALDRDISLAWNPRLLKVRPEAERIITFFHNNMENRLSAV